MPSGEYVGRWIEEVRQSVRCFEGSRIERTIVIAENGRPQIVLIVRGNDCQRWALFVRSDSEAEYPGWLETARVPNEINEDDVTAWVRGQV